MPLHTYRCPEHHTVDVLEPRETPPETCARCGGPMVKHAVYPTRTVGPVWIDMERYNLAHFSRAELQAGAGFKSAAEIEKREAELGLTRIDPKSRLSKQLDADYADAERQEQVLGEKEGEAAVDELIREDTIREAVPEFDHDQYVRWRNLQDAVDARVAADPEFRAQLAGESGGSVDGGAVEAAPGQGG